MKKETPTWGVQVYDSEGNKVPVPESGTLSLLALGYRGLMAWREVRKLPQRTEEQAKSSSKKDSK